MSSVKQHPDSRQRLINYDPRNFAFALGLPGPPVQAFHLIRQNHTSNAGTRIERHFERVTFHPGW